MPSFNHLVIFSQWLLNANRNYLHLLCLSQIKNTDVTDDDKPLVDLLLNDFWWDNPADRR